MLFRVKLVLDGVPRHAWDAEIVERLISRHCALEVIDIDLLHPVETKTIDLWAWAANPSSIPKRIWLTFTSRAKDVKLSSVLVSETPPEHWQQGRKFPVLVHLEEIHDYSAATVDERGAFSPAKRRLPMWNLGVPDGEPVPVRAAPAFTDDGRDARGRGSDQPRLRDDKEGRSSRGRYNNDHPDHLRARYGRRHDDDDGDGDERDRHGRDGGDGYRRRGHGKYDGSIFRERERSPRRRAWGHGSRCDGHQRGAAGGRPICSP